MGEGSNLNVATGAGPGGVGQVVRVLKLGNAS